ncbi:AAA family ATPase [Pseudogemmatithrix spongiicola]|uniref:AAA family ATPase n=1 Tax=Pseudogemmatithrix spongiicola TaxID=3062599 RepID=A0AA49JZ63_9BACT|nr:AAA family ATPase [Gemmatimonadaceae bacterium 'strain 138']WKW14646.1 AAA family ATPase [Gemmatimonadaceae bacterium 'strain 318']
MNFQRHHQTTLLNRLRQPRRFIQAVTGPRQVGKSTLVQQAVAALDVPVRYVSADEPTLRGPEWIAQQWDATRLASTGEQGAVLVIDEIQKLPQWSETVKRLWDEDSRRGVPLKVVLLGSSPILIAEGLSESLAGRFESITAGHWSFAEMRDAFGWSLEQYLFYGGYPGAAPLIAGAHALATLPAR